MNMKRVIVYEGKTDIVKKVFMEDLTGFNCTINDRVASIYPDCDFVIDEFNYGSIDVSKTAKEIDESLKKSYYMA